MDHDRTPDCGSGAPKRRRPARFLLAALAVGVGIQAVAPAGSASAAGGTDRIALVSDRDGDPDIYLVDPASPEKPPTQITTDGAPKSYVAISPDGTRIAFVKAGAIWTMPIKGGDAVRLTTDDRPESAPAWSPDGTSIVFARQYGGRQPDLDIVIRAIASGSETRVASPGNDANPDWSANPSAPIAFNSSRTGTPQLWRMEADGTKPQQVTAGKHSSIEPAWSPDGRRLAFVRWHPGSTGMAVTTLDLGSRVERRLGDGNVDFGPSWSPDGSTIAYRHLDKDAHRTYTVAADGSAPARLLPGQVGNSSNPDWGTVAVDDGAPPPPPPDCLLGLFC